MALFIAMPGYAAVETATQLVNELKSQINDNTDGEIADLYQELARELAEYETVDEKPNNTSIDKLKENAQAMKERENSTANKLLGAAGIGAMGIGGMQALSALAEQSADDAADQDMRAYLATFRCDYGQGRNIVGGETNIQLPGASELTQYTTEYKQIAANLKANKEALGLLPGIESELVLDSATTGLYDDVSVGTQKGAFTSLSRALLDENSADAAELSEMYKDTLKKRQTGTAIAVGGAVATIAGNLAINGIKSKNDDIGIDDNYEENKYEKLPPAERIDAMESDLRKLISENERLMNEYNENLRLHKEYIVTITDTNCREILKSYIERIEELEPVTDKLQQIPVIGYDLAEAKDKYNQCKTNGLNRLVADEVTTRGIQTGYQNVCNGTPKDTCIKGVFNWINVNMIQAVRIAKEYARVKDGKTITSCSNEWVTWANDDYVLCKTADGVYYTFQFDDVTESNSDKIRDNSAKAICEGVYKGRYESPSGLLNEGLPKNAVCRFTGNSRSSCNELKTVLAYFDFAVYNTNKPNTCFIYFTPYSNYVKSKGKRLPVYGRQKYVQNNQYPNVDNYEFRKMGLQMRGDIAVVDMIKYWLHFKTGKDLSKIRCNDGVTAYYDSDANGSGDDILACFVDGRRVDLVFDDFSENWTVYTKQALQAGICMSNGAVYTGSSCIGAGTGMTQAQCNRIKESFRQNCPTCYPPKWENGVCKTQENAAFVSFIDTYGPTVGLTVASVALAIPTGGMSMTAWVGVGATATSIGAGYSIASEIDNFINDVSSRCRNSDCAKNILSQYLTRMLNLQGDVSSVQANALDTELARLLNLLPQADKTALVAQYRQGGSTVCRTGVQCVKFIATWVGVTASVASMGSSLASLSFPKTLQTIRDWVDLISDGFNIVSSVAS